MLVITEDFDSRQTRRFKRDGVLETNVECKFTIKGSDDPLAAEVKLLGPQDGEAFGDGSHNLYVFERSWDVVKPGATDGIMRLLVKYGPPERLPQNNNGDEPEHEFAIGGQTVHVERSLRSQLHYPNSKDGVGDLIGVSSEKIEGVDIFSPQPSWQQTRYVDNLSKAYVRNLHLLANTVNNAPFKFWDADEVLFLGVMARRKGFGKWKLDFNFSVSLNAEQSILTTSGVQNFEKKGWDYMWFEKSQTANGMQVVHEVNAVHVAPVYRRTNFALLGLGTSVNSF